ncbi:MAG TPA: YibE/F family protein [Patescibacteria group bacterium]|nr:YibE/F family protein [Patescibacteria group bacterium]
MNKLAAIILTAVVLALAWGAYKVETAPLANRQKFSIAAADPSAAPYAELDKARVLTVSDNSEVQGSRYSRITARLQVRLLTGREQGQQVEVVQDEQLTDARLQEIHPGDIIVVGQIQIPVPQDQSLGGPAQAASYVLVDRYRLPGLAALAAIFLILAALLGRWRGLTSLVGLAVSAGILIWFVAPNILAGKDPVVVTLVGAGGIALVSMFLAHGFNRRTVLAVISTLLTLGLAEVLAYYAVIWTRLFGNGSEEAFYLQQGFAGNINLRGLLLGGILIGSLGILNDITTAQAAAVAELRGANSSLTLKELYQKGLSVGREHIASLINTLVLVYVGTSLPLFLLVTLTTVSQQWWAILNSGSLAEEIVRTLVGGLALILAVPITTILAAFVFSRRPSE